MAASTARPWLTSPLLLVHSLSSSQASVLCMLAAPGAVSLDEAAAELIELGLEARHVGVDVLAGRQAVLGHPDLAPQRVHPPVELVERLSEIGPYIERPSSLTR